MAGTTPGRLPLMAGNWKMNLNHIEAVGLVQKLAWTLSDKRHDPEKSEVVVFPPFTDLRTVQTLVEGDRLKIAYGAQDVSPHDNGAFTGDVSASMLAKLNCSYVIIGHSERRQHHGEDDTTVNAKAKQALKAGIVPLICVGEDRFTREEGRHIEHVVEQIRGALEGLTAEQVGGLVIAYEPIWAIGTGHVATPDDAQEVAAAIRATIRKEYGDPVADAVRILYGGSVKATNVAQIMAEADIDGCLVGGASLVVDEFAAIARFYDLPALS
jgi:triosephosphate isomerase